MTTSRSRAWLLACLLSGGCAFRAQLLSDPPGARVRLPQTVEAVGVPRARRIGTPAEVVVRGSPYRRQVVEVTAPGHRPMSVDLSRIEGRLLRRIEVAFTGPRRREITFVLLEEQPPVGTAGAAQ